MAHKRKYVNINGHKWAYIEQGSSRKPNLFLIHGGFGYADNYHRVLAQLGKKYHTIVPDLPGFGFTTSCKPNTYKTIVKEFQQFIRHFGLEPGLIFASSMGGGLTLKALIDDPELFSYCLIQSPLWQKADLENDLVEIIAKKLANVPPKLINFIQKPRYTRWFFKLLSYIDKQDRGLYTSENQRLVEGLGLLDIKGFQEFFNSIDDNTLSKELKKAKFTVPLIFLAGDKVDAILPEQTLPLAKLLKKPMVLVPGEGHQIVHEGPEKVVNLINFIGFGMTLENSSQAGSKKKPA